MSVDLTVAPFATVTGRVYRDYGVSDGPVPDAVPGSGYVIFTPLLLAGEAAPVGVPQQLRVPTPIDPVTGEVGPVLLWAGSWQVRVPGVTMPDEVVLEAGQSYDLAALRGYVPGPGVSVTTMEVPTPSGPGYLSTDGTSLSWSAGTTGTPGEGGTVDSVNGQTGTVVLGAADVGAEPAGAMAAHMGAADPHPQYLTPAEGDGRYLPASYSPPAPNLSGYVQTTDARLSDARTPLAHTHPWADVTGKPATYPPALHTHTVADLADGATLTTDVELTAGLAGKADSGHTHAVADLTASGTRDATTYLRGDGTWATPTQGAAPAADDHLPLHVFRAAAAARTTRPVSVVIAGSSTTYGTGASTLSLSAARLLIKQLQADYPVATGNQEPATQYFSSTAGASSAPTAPGITLYNYSVGSTNSSNFLTAEKVASMGVLQPSLIILSPGNDVVSGTSIATFKANMTSWMDQIDQQVTVPHDYLLMSMHPRSGGPFSPSQADYAQALAEIADSRADAWYANWWSQSVDLNLLSGDPYDLIGADLTHLTDRGHDMLARYLHSMIVPNPARVIGTAESAPAGSVIRALWSTSLGAYVDSAGAALTARPTTRTDVSILLVGAPAGTATPAWCISGDIVWLAA